MTHYFDFLTKYLMAHSLRNIPLGQSSLNLMCIKMTLVVF